MVLVVDFMVINESWSCIDGESYNENQRIMFTMVSMLGIIDQRIIVSVVNVLIYESWYAWEILLINGSWYRCRSNEVLLVDRIDQPFMKTENNPRVTRSMCLEENHLQRMILIVQ
jgi:hypothetical protein